MKIQMDISILGRHWALLNWMYVIYIFFHIFSFSMSIMLNHVFFKAKFRYPQPQFFFVCSQQLPNLHSTLQGCAPGLGGFRPRLDDYVEDASGLFSGYIWNRIGTKTLLNIPIVTIVFRSFPSISNLPKNVVFPFCLVWRFTGSNHSHRAETTKRQKGWSPDSWLFHRKFHCHNWKRFIYIWFHVHSIGTTYLLAEKTNQQDTGHIKVFMW